MKWNLKNMQLWSNKQTAVKYQNKLVKKLSQIYITHAGIINLLHGECKNDAVVLLCILPSSSVIVIVVASPTLTPVVVVDSDKLYTSFGSRAMSSLVTSN